MKKILIVEDDIVSRILLKTLFKNMINAEVHEVNNGKNAIVKLEEEKYDIMFLDIVMPIMNGKDLLKHIRSTKNYSHMSIIATTTDSDSKNEMFDLGIDDFISKPIKKEILLNSLEKFVII